jgi:hypothetical protein
MSQGQALHPTPMVFSSLCTDSSGLVSRAGVIPISTQDRVGVHAKSVADAALLLTHPRGFDPEDLTTADSLGQIDPKPYTEYLNDSPAVKQKKVRGFPADPVHYFSPLKLEAGRRPRRAVQTPLASPHQPGTNRTPWRLSGLRCSSTRRTSSMLNKRGPSSWPEPSRGVARKPCTSPFLVSTAMPAI